MDKPQTPCYRLLVSGSSIKPQSAQLTYKDAGVDIDAGDDAVRRIARLLRNQRGPLSDLGGFAGLFAVPKGLTEPVLVSCADGVGTKLLIAVALGRHDTVGIDLVAMNVNDLLVTGARALFMLDYIATSRVDPQTIEAIVGGVIRGCEIAGCSLLGGETAEHPGLHPDGHYDLAGFAVGVVERAKLLGPHRVGAGDVILALPSSGLHSNGYSLARKALLDPDHGGLALGEPLPGAETTTVGEALLEPTRIYEPAFAVLRELDGSPLRGAAHITGGGLIDNPPRALADDLVAEIDLGNIAMPPAIQAVADQGVARDELHRTFNCGIGMLLYVDRERVTDVTRALADAGEAAVTVGEVVARPTPNSPRVRLTGG